MLEVMLEVLEEGRQESLPIILCEPDSFGGHSEPLKPVITRDALVTPWVSSLPYAASQATQLPSYTGLFA